MINKKYTATKKNNGIIPMITDERVRYVAIGCGVCIECLKQKANNWKIRLHEEYKNQNMIGQFVTLTFSNEAIHKLNNCFESPLKDPDQNNEIAIKAVRLFLERFRKSNKKSARHWLVTELGHTNTERIHLHGIIWASKEDIEKHWQYGWVYIGNYVNEKTINYIIKYITKIDKDHTWFKPKVLCSPGIGSSYTKTHNSTLKIYNEKNTDESYNYPNGLKGGLPTYYRNKLYTESEREKLWLQRLDKQERWVRGVKVSVKEGYEEYYKLRDLHRIINEQMKYGKKESSEEIYQKKIHHIKKLSKLAEENPQNGEINLQYSPNTNFDNENNEILKK